MGEVLFKCRWCSETVSVAETKVGHVVACPSCHKRNTVRKVALEIECPHCSEPLQVSDQFLGEAIFCPKCHNEIDLEEEDVPDGPTSDEGRAEGKTFFNCPSCSAELTAPVGAIEKMFNCPNCSNLVQVPAMTPADAMTGQPMPQYEACPFCKKSSPVGAVLCTYCGRNLKSRRFLGPSVTEPPTAEWDLDSNILSVDSDDAGIIDKLVGGWLALCVLCTALYYTLLSEDSFLIAFKILAGVAILIFVVFVVIGSSEAQRQIERGGAVKQVLLACLGLALWCGLTWLIISGAVPAYRLPWLLPVAFMIFSFVAVAGFKHLKFKVEQEAENQNVLAKHEGFLCWIDLWTVAWGVMAIAYYALRPRVDLFPVLRVLAPLVVIALLADIAVYVFRLSTLPSSKRSGEMFLWLVGSFLGIVFWLCVFFGVVSASIPPRYWGWCVPLLFFASAVLAGITTQVGYAVVNRRRGQFETPAVPATPSRSSNVQGELGKSLGAGIAAVVICLLLIWGQWALIESLDTWLIVYIGFIPVPLLGVTLFVSVIGMIAFFVGVCRGFLEASTSGNDD